jgi:hypothetical protein
VERCGRAAVGKGDHGGAGVAGVLGDPACRAQEPAVVVLRSRPYETRRALVISLVLIGLGVLGTFPTFFQLFGE